MPAHEAPSVELGSAPQTPSVVASPTPSEISSTSSPEPQNIRATPLFRALAMPPPDPIQPAGQDELERRLPGYRRIVIPRDLTLIELLKQSSGVTTDEEVLRMREAKLHVVAERVGLRRLHVLAPRLRSLTLDGSAISSLRDLGIGLVHLKILSVNRCGLTCLDGVWGLGALRELHAAGNRLRDLQPLAALQRLHTLDLADNPLTESSRLWTLGVCGSLRHLSLKGTPASEALGYRDLVVFSLPALVTLDGRPLHTDLDEDEPPENLDGAASSDSEIEEELINVLNSQPRPPAEPQPGPSESYESLPEQSLSGDGNGILLVPARPARRRPATTEGAGARPGRPNVPPRPRTAVERPHTDTSSRLHILNTLMDDEWRSSGSRLTSHEAVCGNIARALRRPASARRRTIEAEGEMELLESSLEDASRVLAAEIPRAPRLEDWDKFRQETGIDINIDFNDRPKGDPLAAIERIERIEKETLERLNDEKNSTFVNFTPRAPSFGCTMTTVSDYELWPEIEDVPPIIDPRDEVDTLFNEIRDITLQDHC